MGVRNTTLVRPRVSPIPAKITLYVHVLVQLKHMKTTLQRPTLCMPLTNWAAYQCESHPPFISRTRASIKRHLLALDNCQQPLPVRRALPHLVAAPRSTSRRGIAVLNDCHIWCRLCVLVREVFMVASCMKVRPADCTHVAQTVGSCAVERGSAARRARAWRRSFRRGRGKAAPTSAPSMSSARRTRGTHLPAGLRRGAKRDVSSGCKPSAYRPTAGRAAGALCMQQAQRAHARGKRLRELQVLFSARCWQPPDTFPRRTPPPLSCLQQRPERRTPARPGAAATVLQPCRGRARGLRCALSSGSATTW